jgi:hypothetical protein
MSHGQISKWDAQHAAGFQQQNAGVVVDEVPVVLFDLLDASMEMLSKATPTMLSERCQAVHIPENQCSINRLLRRICELVDQNQGLKTDCFLVAAKYTVTATSSTPTLTTTTVTPVKYNENESSGAGFQYHRSANVSANTRVFFSVFFVVIFLAALVILGIRKKAQRQKAERKAWEALQDMSLEEQTTPTQSPLSAAESCSRGEQDPTQQSNSVPHEEVAVPF